MGGIKKIDGLILEKIWKRVVKKKLWKKPGKKLILPWWVKNEEKKLKNAYVQNLQIGLLLIEPPKKSFRQPPAPFSRATSCSRQWAACQ